MIKIYQKYLIKNFIKKFLLISFVFFSLVVLLGLLEEITFLDGATDNYLLPYILTTLNAPITLFEIFPFIFLLTTLYLFYELSNKDELDLLKKNGLSNLKIIKILFFLSLLIGVFNILFFYNFSSKLKSIYTSVKNELSDDKKYLDVVNDNGLWIKDIIDNKTLIIKSKKINENYLQEAIINEFDEKFNLLSVTRAEKIDIQSNIWKIYEPQIYKDNQIIKNKNTIEIQTNFDKQKINSLFSNVSTLNILQLFYLQRDYKKLGYSSDEVTIHIYKIFSTPLYYGLLTILSAIIMFNFTKTKSLITHIVLGVALSVLIYYISYIFNIMGANGKIPIILSIFFPLIIISIISTIGLININEK